jgi:hypothetical protein
MNTKFKRLIDTLEANYQKLIGMAPVYADSMPTDAPKGGVYLFSEDGKHLYTGRTKRKISIRVRNHFSSAPDCPFAWQIAREVTNTKATYKREGSRKELLKDPRFRNEYEKAKKRIRKMQVRYIHEPDPMRQAILEIYVSVVADTKYNDFDTH